MAQTYTKAQVLRAGKELVGLLIEKCNASGNISGFLKDYMESLTSKNGIFNRQRTSIDHFAEVSTNIQEKAQAMVLKNQGNSRQIQSICSEFDRLNRDISDMQRKKQALNENVASLTQKIKEISNFIRSIQDVSEQTNLLSFNASIEAARAGNAGKGFRIIANEVKNLSDRTTKLSADIDVKVRELENEVRAVVDENKANENFMTTLQQTAVDSSEQLSQIQADFGESSDFTESILVQMRENHDSILRATEETEKQNIESVSEIAGRAAENTIQTGDLLSFLFELEALFAYLEEHKELFA